MGGDLGIVGEFESESERWARWDQVHEEILRLARRLMQAREDSEEIQPLVSRLEHLLDEVEQLRRSST
jgi:hypothetical protein